MELVQTYNMTVVYTCIFGSELRSDLSYKSSREGYFAHTISVGVIVLVLNPVAAIFDWN
jgi:hypothetical protein